ncbi:hypothetical protein [Halobaculum lipolyticum]|uniref:Uncharacterized protein n=1 Tax=Halobaculum lipolyticum TaxID=3032001 RepID=A0ABD5WA62_9EURY|nr:hypothetical protein [Halobaculum sp. DT31]
MNRRALSVGGLAVAGVSQVVLGVVEYTTGNGPGNWVFSVLAGAMLAFVFGRALVRGDDLNGLATRPLFVAVGVFSGVASTLVALAVVLAL